MGKPQRGVGNRDVFHRMNFLHQAARLLAPSAPAAARQLSSLAGAVARKSVLRVEARVKRAACKRCSTPLVDGDSSSVRLRKKRLVVRCLTCGWVKRYGLDKVPWGQRPEALVATTVFDGRKNVRDEAPLNEVKDTRSKEERRKDRIKEAQIKERSVGDGEATKDEGNKERGVGSMEGEAEIEKMKTLHMTGEMQPVAEISVEAMEL